MGIWRSLAGTVQVEIVSADLALSLSEIIQSGVVLFDVTYTGALTAHANIYRQDYRQLKVLMKRRCEKIRIIKRNGIYWGLKKLLRRPFISVGLVLFLLGVIYIPGRIFFVNVEGNNTIPTKLILEKAESCGIRFGSIRRNVRSEKMKNALLSAIPDLQWAGINTSGCVATISVREKSVSDSAPEKTSGISSIVALRDGVIRDYTVIQGNGLCYVGQAVKKGQLLVSGYTDVGLTIKGTQAKAEIYAQTLRGLEMVTPVSASVRGSVSHSKTRYALRIGKKLIKFYKDSGISDASCVKMYSEEYLTLPGGFRLPIAIVQETVISYDMLTEASVQAEDYSWMESAASVYLQNQMIAGRILEAKTAVTMQEDCCFVQGRYACLEMIGQEKNEEIVQQDGENG